MAQVGSPNTEITRLFCALQFDSNTLQPLYDQVQSTLNPAIWRINPLNRWHVTLCFIGSINAAEQHTLLENLTTFLTHMSSITLKICGSTLLSTSHRILALKIEPQPDLMDLVYDLSEMLRALNIKHDARAFLPHMSVARHKTADIIDHPLLPLPTTRLTASQFACLYSPKPGQFTPYQVLLQHKL